MELERFYAICALLLMFGLGVFTFKGMKMENDAALETQRLLAKCGGDNASR